MFMKTVNQLINHDQSILASLKKCLYLQQLFSLLKNNKTSRLFPSFPVFSRLSDRAVANLRLACPTSR